MRDINDLEDTYLITGNLTSNEQAFIQKVEKALSNNIKMMHLRIKNVSSQIYNNVAHRISEICEKYNCHLILNHSLDNIPDINIFGIHLTSERLMQYKKIDPAYKARYWLSAAVHNISELKHAEQLGLDFAVLSPIKQSFTYPGAPVLGWKQAIELREMTSIPLYAAGGMVPEDIPRLKDLGFLGIAAIHSLWQ